jgi:hypothetical protein
MKNLQEPYKTMAYVTIAIWIAMFISFVYVSVF